MIEQCVTGAWLERCIDGWEWKTVNKQIHIGFFDENGISDQWCQDGLHNKYTETSSKYNTNSTPSKNFTFYSMHS